MTITAVFHEPTYCCAKNGVLPFEPHEIRNADMRKIEASNLERIYISGIRRVFVMQSCGIERVCRLVKFDGSVWLWYRTSGE